MSLLSLPPEANCISSKDHLSPQTSYLCPTNFITTGLEALKSLCKILRSLEPMLTIELFHATQPTLLRCPDRVLTSLQCVVSQI